MTYREACCSIFSLHNETMNVWTHLLGALLFVWHLASLCAALSAATGSTTVLGLAVSASAPTDLAAYKPHTPVVLGGIHSKELLRLSVGPPTSPLCPGSRSSGDPLAPPHTPFHVALHWVDSASKSIARAEADLLLQVAASGAHATRQLRPTAPAASSPLLNATRTHLSAFRQTMDALRRKVQSSALLSQEQLASARMHLAAAVSELRVDAAAGKREVQQRVADAVASATQQWNVLMHQAGVSNLGIDLRMQSVRDPHAIAMVIIATCAALTMGISAVFHLLFVVGRPEASVLQRLDYAGIVILTAGSTFAAVYFFFFCRPVAFWVYSGVATVVNVYVGVMAQTDAFGSTEYDLLRPAAFTVAGVVCGVPILHALFLPELQHLQAFWDMLYFILLQGVFYLVGVSMYASKFPERLLPGWCDVFLGSHQLFHVCVAAAAWMLYTGAQHMEEYLELHPNFCMVLE